MKTLRNQSVAIALVFLLPFRVHASIFGEENVVLGGILSEAIKTSADLGSILTTVRQSADEIRKNAQFAADAVQVVTNVHQIMKDPMGYLEANAKQFVSSFPEIEEVRYEVDRLRHEFENVGKPGEYDPFAFARVFTELRERKENAYDIVARLVDLWGVGDPHDKMLKQVQKDQRAAAKILADVENDLLGNGFTPQDAAVATARASALGAKVSAESLATQQEMLRLMKLRFIDEVEAANQARAAYHAMYEPEADAPEELDWSLQVSVRKF